jgi:hypothetical protein
MDEIKKISSEIKNIRAKRQILTSNSIRTALLIMADGAVKAYNIIHSALQPMPVTHKVLRDVSSKFWEKVIIFQLPF